MLIAVKLVFGVMSIMLSFKVSKSCMVCGNTRFSRESDRQRNVQR